MSFEDIADFFEHVTPSYLPRRPSQMHFEYGWRSDLVNVVRRISEKRAEKRVQSYIIPSEIERARGVTKRVGFRPSKDGLSPRFGFHKSGRGGRAGVERADFCLIAGSYAKRRLTLFYRSLELIGGLHYDQCIIDHVQRELAIKLETVEVFAVQASVFARKGNSNEALHHKLKEAYANHA